MLLSAVVLITSLWAGQTAPRFEQLDNGLHVVIVEDRALPLVCVQLWYHAGSACDPTDRPGLCEVSRAMLEHRVDAASEPRTTNVHFASRTERDACYFSSVISPDFLESMLDIEAARMQPLTPTQEIVDSESCAAALRFAATADDASRVVMHPVLAAMFADHPYRHPPGFAGESLQDLSPGEVSEFLRRWFVPANATLLVIGDVPEVTALDQIRRRFAGLERFEPSPRPEARRLKPQIVRIPTPGGGRAGVTVAWRTAALGHFENAAIDVLMQRLCNTVDGPLCQRLTAIGCEPPRWQRHAWRDAGLLVLSVALCTDTAPAKPGRIETLIEHEFVKAAQHTPTEIAHNRARALAKREALERIAAFPDRAHQWGVYEVVAGDALLADFAVARVARVTIPHTQQAAAELIETRRVILPASSSADASGSAAPGRSRQPTSQTSAEPRLPTNAPGPHERLTTHALDNGVSVVVRRLRGTGELADVSTLLTTSRPSPESAQTLLDIGSTRRSAAEIRDYLSYHGLDLSLLRRDSRLGLHSRGPTSRVAQLVELQSELLRHPADVQAAALGEIRKVEILVAGDVDTAAALAAVRLAWGDWRAPEARD